MFGRNTDGWVGCGPEELGYLWRFKGSFCEEFVLGVAITIVIEDVVGLQLVLHVGRFGVGNRGLMPWMRMRGWY